MDKDYSKVMLTLSMAKDNYAQAKGQLEQAKGQLKAEQQKVKGLKQEIKLLTDNVISCGNALLAAMDAAANIGRE